MPPRRREPTATDMRGRLPLRPRDVCTPSLRLLRLRLRLPPWLPRRRFLLRRRLLLQVLIQPGLLLRRPGLLLRRRLRGDDELDHGGLGVVRLVDRRLDIRGGHASGLGPPPQLPELCARSLLIPITIIVFAINITIPFTFCFCTIRNTTFPFFSTFLG